MEAIGGSLKRVAGHFNGAELLVMFGHMDFSAAESSESLMEFLPVMIRAFVAQDATLPIIAVLLGVPSGRTDRGVLAKITLELYKSGARDVVSQSGCMSESHLCMQLSERIARELDEPSELPEPINILQSHSDLGNDEKVAREGNHSLAIGCGTATALQTETFGEDLTEEFISGTLGSSIQNQDNHDMMADGLASSEFAEHVPGSPRGNFDVAVESADLYSSQKAQYRAYLLARNSETRADILILQNEIQEASQEISRQRSTSQRLLLENMQLKWASENFDLTNEMRPNLPEDPRFFLGGEIGYSRFLNWTSRS